MKRPVVVVRRKSHRESDNSVRAAWQMAKALSNIIIFVLLAAAGNAGDPDSLDRLLKRAEADPSDMESRLKLIEIFIEQGNFAQAETYLKLAQAIDSSSAMVYFLWGRYYDYQDNLALAMSNYNSAIDRDSTLAEAWRARAYLHEIFANYELMLSDLNHALAATKDSAGVFYDIGVAYDYLGDIENAGASYKSALSCGAQFPEIFVNLGAYWADIGDFDSANYYLALAIKSGGDSPELHYNLGMVNFQQGNYQRAISDFYDCLSVAPEFAAAKLQLGYLYELVGDTGMAITYLEDFINTAPIIYNQDIAKAKEKLARLRK